MRRFVLSIIIFGYIVCYAGEFVYQTIDYTYGVGEMVIAPGRNDGVNRLYYAGFGFYEFTWQDSLWHKETILEMTNAPYTLAAGFGRNDSVWRLYGGGVGGKRLYEYTYNGGIWDSVLIEGVIDVDGGIQLGDIKNDDTIRVVAGGGSKVTMAYTYHKGSNSWSAETISVHEGDILGINIGKGRNDDTNRIYIGGQGIWVIECWYNGSNWVKDTVGYGFDDCAVGIGRNDGVDRLYLYGLSESTWTVDHWVSNGLDTSSGSYGGQCVVANGRNDGINRLYVAGRVLGEPADSSGYYVYVLEKSYDSITGWTRNEIKAITYSAIWPMWNITVGDARNDSKNRIYGSVSNGHLIEFTWDDTLSGVAGTPVSGGKVYSLKLGQNYPNPFRQSTVISYQATGTGPVSLSIYNIAGQLVKTLTPPNPPLEGRDQSEGSGSVTWDGRDDNGRAVANGVYVYRLIAGGKSISKKMIIIK